MEEKQKKKKKIKKILLLIYIIFLLSIILSNGLSKYRSTYAQVTNAEIAKPIANVVAENDLSIENLYNEYVEWNFSVNNFTEDEINQVPLSYKIKIDKGGLTELQYELYKIENEEAVQIAMDNDISVNEQRLSNTNVQEDKYCLKIKTTDEVTQKGLEGNINVTITIIQINE